MIADGMLRQHGPGVASARVVLLLGCLGCFRNDVGRDSVHSSACAETIYLCVEVVGNVFVGV